MTITAEAPQNSTHACRSCASTQVVNGICARCGSKLYAEHAELHDLAIAHMDCDAFFAAIEKRDNPQLADKPVIIGGGKRGVVATACYIARLYGVRSAMPMFKALKACPEAVVIKSNFAKYQEASRIIREKMLDLTPLVQPVSIDEAYLDLTGTAALHKASPAQSLIKLQNEIAKEVGITVSIGLSFNKFLAKAASDLDKPAGFSVIGKGEVKAFLADQPIRFIHGIGPATARSIESKGFSTLGDIQQSDIKRLISLFGETGLWLHDRANGIDPRPVDPSSERKSISSETTFGDDLRDRTALEDHLALLCEKTASRAKTAGLQGHTVTLKLKTADFKSRTRQTQLSTPTDLARPLFQAARHLLAREVDGAAFRLIGVGLSELVPSGEDMADLADPSALRFAKAERAADKAREKFGAGKIVSGRSLRVLAEREAKRDSSDKDDKAQRGVPRDNPNRKT